MYEELMKSLRICAGENTCVGCIKNTEGKDYCDIINCDIELVRDAADAIEELQGQIDAWVEQERKALIKSLPKWIPVTERVPKYGTPVLAYGSRGGMFVAKYERARAEWDRDYWWKLNSSIHVCNPTHWMPLPEPPKEET